ncbi:MAG: imidazole glycerol phosphate synthase subunit HisH [Chitinophagaceae bacterium]|nr:imidazole glycerol phosphate synthase subunit HisH [Chitinophagaceae bacterium]
MIAIIKYNAGNIQSVQYALQRLGVNALVTDNHEEIRNADKVIFPGVGNANSAMESLRKKNLDNVIKQLKQPVLGICVGMQLMCKHSEENNTECLGIVDLEVKKFSSPQINAFKIPQIGWNIIQNFRSPLFEGIKENAFVYYVHSYYAGIGIETIATTDYIVSYSAVIQKDNFYGVQFHTEKSAEVGDRILLNFLNIKP